MSPLVLIEPQCGGSYYRMTFFGPGGRRGDSFNVAPDQVRFGVEEWFRVAMPSVYIEIPLTEDGAS